MWIGMWLLIGRLGVRLMEDILRAVNFYRYMTVLDMAHELNCMPGLVRLRGRLTALCGGDFVDGEYLYRLRLAHLPRGNPERIYVLGSLGWDYLENVLGVPVSWYFRPGRVKHLGFSALMHNLVLTRFLVCAKWWCLKGSELKIGSMRICYELGEPSVSGGTGADGVSGDKGDKGGRKKVSVIPDGWILFEKMRGGAVLHKFPVLLEIDRGTMYRARFKRHVLSRIEYVERGEYERVFGVEAVVVAYAVTGAAGELMEGRRKALCEWTVEALRETGREDWASVFRFCSVGFDSLYESPLFDGRVWYVPGERAPVRLFGE